MQKRYQWKLKQREINLGERTFLMGVLNVTPDSFSDGGKYADPDRWSWKSRERISSISALNRPNPARNGLRKPKNCAG
jgi:hypothetical protein